MKNIFKATLLAITISLFVISCTKKETKHPNIFTLTGEIKGLSGDLYYRHPDKKYSRERRSDTITVVNGKIQFSDTISKLAMIRAYPNFKGPDNKVFKIPKDGKGMFPSKSSYLMFYVFPGAEVTISGEFTDYVNAYPGGDKFNESLAAANKITFPNFNKMGNLAVQNTYETDSTIIKANNEEAEEIFNNYKAQIIEHIKNNPKSLAAAWYLNDMYLRRQIDDAQAEELFNALSKDALSEYEDYKNVVSRIEGTKATKAGMPVPEIKTKSTPDGSEFEIASLRGKYILIDFWGVWCGPCVAEMPTLKRFQEKYKEKLVVLGINSGDTKEKMQKFLEENDYKWQQLMSVRGDSIDNFVTRFNVQGFPTKFIIDPDGKIVKRHLGSGEETFKLLETLLEK